eukprot:Rmarinus@m.6252
MSLHSMPLLVLNMGGEMIYILEQRLRAQSIALDKRRKVLHDVIRTMFDPRFIEELFKPQDLYSVHMTRDVFNKLAHSSIMKLNEASMDKLFDLMTMGFKYQLVCCAYPEELLKCTQNHLLALLELIDEEAVQASVNQAMSRLTSFYSELPLGDMMLLRQSLCRFVHDRRVKVSLFLQDGIQNQDGSIVLPKQSPLPPRVEAPGTLRIYEGGAVVKEMVIPNPSAMCVQAGAKLEDTSLGSNLYSRRRNKEDVLPQTSSESVRPEPDSQPRSYETVSGDKEMSQLASLIKVSKPSTNEFKLQLFQAEASSGFASGGGKSAGGGANVVMVDATVDQGHLKEMVAEMSLDDGKDDGPDDLLDLMDSAGV